MRTIEEIKADIKDCEKCVKLKHLCSGVCNICDCIHNSNLPGFETELRLTLVSDIPLSRLEEICNAERDGRCVVLPFPEGTQLYEVKTIFGEPCLNKFVFDRRISNEIVKSIGKTVFLTFEAAEQVLKEAMADANKEKV